MPFEVKDFGNGLKVVFLGLHTDTSPNWSELKKLRDNEFKNIPDDQVRLWVDDCGNFYFGTSHKS